MMTDSIFVAQDSIHLLQSVISDLISNRISILSDSGIQLDDTLLQIRLTTLAIVVGVVLFTPEIKKGRRLPAAIIFVVILEMPFGYDLVSRDQQIRRQEKVQGLEREATHISNLSDSQLKLFEFEYGDKWTKAGVWARLCHRFSNVQGDWWFWLWYLFSRGMGIILLLCRSHFVERKNT